MNSKKIILLTTSLLALVAGGYLLLQLQTAFDEYTHWRSREAVLEKELEDLRQEAKTDRKFLDRLRRDPDFQDAIARKELGYGKTNERLYRLPKDDEEKPQAQQP